MIVKCQPCYLLREFTTVFTVRCTLHLVLTREALFMNSTGPLVTYRLCTHKGFVIVAKDFKHVNLKSVLPEFHQHVDFAIHEINNLGTSLHWHLWCLQECPHKPPNPTSSCGDHISVMLFLAYEPHLKMWLTSLFSHLSHLQDYFERLQNVQRGCWIPPHLEDYTASLTGYISWSIDDVTSFKAITMHAN